VSAICAHAGHELRPLRWLLHRDKPGTPGFTMSSAPGVYHHGGLIEVCQNWSAKNRPPFCWSMKQELSRRGGLPHATIIIGIGTTNGVIQRRPGSGSPSPGGAAALHLSCRRDTLRQDLPHCPHDYNPCARGKGFPPVILRHHANAARASIALGTLPQVVQLCFPGMRLKEHRQDGYFALPNGSRVWIGGLDDNDRVEKILGLEYASVFLNEASQIPYSTALIAFTRLAQVTRGIRQHAFVDLNPAGKSHWTNVLFGEQRDPVSMQPLKDPENYRRAFLNPPDNTKNLSAEFLASLENLPEKQRKRFYEGVYVDEVDGALWTYETIDSGRRAPEDIPDEKRAAVVVALDPSGAAGRDDLGADEIGIVVAARGFDGDCYVLSDLSCREAPAVWARRAAIWALTHLFGADDGT
jgi:hypothetical protein